jgi:glycosyltransferase involved in cell wall biosynthesis
MTQGERVICVSRCVSDHVRRHYPGTPPSRLTVIPRGVDRAHYHHGFRPEPGWRAEFVRSVPLAAEGLLLTLPGRGTRLKGHAEAIQLLADVRQQGLDARLLLLGAREAGREHYVRELLAKAHRLGVGDYLAVTPFRPDAREVMAISHLVLQLSSRPEAFGRTVTEALSLGRPVLGYDHGGVGELLATHFPAGRTALHDREALATRAVALLREPPDMQAVQPPSLVDMQAQTLALYRELIDESP